MKTTQKIVTALAGVAVYLMVVLVGVMFLMLVTGGFMKGLGR